MKWVAASIVVLAVVVLIIGLRATRQQDSPKRCNDPFHIGC